MKHSRILGTLLSVLIALVLCGNAFAQTENLVSNGNFEKPSADGSWADQWGKPKVGGTWENENGNHFLRLVSPAPGTMVLLYREVKIPAGTAALEMTWRQKITGLKPGKQKWFDARIMMNFKDSSGNKIPGDPPAPYARKDTADWEEKNAKFIVPEGATTLVLMPTLFQVESGTFDFDDIVLKPTEAAALKEAAAAAAEAKAQKLAAAASKTQEKAASAMQENGGSLIANGGMEASKNGAWPDNWAKAKEFGTWETEDGNHYIRMTASEPDKMIMLYSVLPLPADAKALELTWRQRVTDVKVGKMPWFDARIILEFKDAAGKKISGPSPSYARGSSNGWVERSQKFLVPEGAVSLVFMPTLFQAASGTYDLDDFSLKPTDPAPVLAAKQKIEEQNKKAYVPPEQPNKEKWPKALHVAGNKILDSDNKEVWLQGLNAGGLETLPTDIHVIKSALVGVDDWKANIVRLPMKEEFWFGRSPFQKDGGAAYRQNIDNIVTIVANRGAYLLLDLHRFRAPKQEHLDFWKDAAAHFKGHPAVLFDLFNEPHGTSWEIWKNGGFVSDAKGTDESAFLTAEEKRKNSGFESVGMQALLNAVRETGAENIVLIAGLTWSNDLSGILNGYALDDKTGNLIYGWHTYNWHKGWDKILPVAAKYPVLVGEFGADEKKMNFIPLDQQEDPYTWVPDMLGFIQKNHLHYTAWCLHPKATPVLISDWDYTPTPFWGVFLKQALAGKQFEMKKMR